MFEKYNVCDNDELPLETLLPHLSLLFPGHKLTRAKTHFSSSPQNKHLQTQSNTITYGSTTDIPNNGENASIDKHYSHMHPSYQYDSSNYQQVSTVEKRYVPKDNVSESNLYSGQFLGLNAESNHHSKDSTQDKLEYHEGKDNQFKTATNSNYKDATISKESAQPIKSEEGLSELSLNHSISQINKESLD